MKLSYFSRFGWLPRTLPVRFPLFLKAGTGETGKRVTNANDEIERQ